MPILMPTVLWAPLAETQRLPDGVTVMHTEEKYNHYLCEIGFGKSLLIRTLQKLAIAVTIAFCMIAVIHPSIHLLLLVQYGVAPVTLNPSSEQF